MSKADKKAKKHDRKPRVPTLAKQADRYELYGLSVQDPDHEVKFFDKVYSEFFGRRKPVILREDFCGTFAVCCAWVQAGRDRIAVGVDLDDEPLEWGRQHNLAPLTASQQQRVTLMQADVRSVAKPKAHILAAQNFSFWIFKTRQAVVEYFKAARENLADDGLFILDMMGGYECFEERHEDIRDIDWPGVDAAGKKRKSFTYVWEQHAFNPVNHDASFYIHFRFRDGSTLKRAFEYHWRFWSVPEVREMLEEAGFGETHAYWEGTLKNGEGDDNWQKAASAPSDPSWIAYIIARK